jgi:CBS domain-containing protein
MATIKQILEKKGHDVWSVGPDDTVYSALELMAEKDIGAVPVLFEGKIVGIFSERDYARKVALKGKASREIPVKELMSTEVCFITPDKTITDAMALMHERKTRHLPVMDGSSITGFMSIGDVVNRIMEEQKTKIHDLESYILGNSYDHYDYKTQ